LSKDSKTKEQLNIKLMPFGYVADALKFKELADKELRKAIRFKGMTEEEAALKVTVNKLTEAAVYQYLLELNEKSAGIKGDTKKAGALKQEIQANQQRLDELMRSGVPQPLKIEEKLPKASPENLFEQFIGGLRGSLSPEKIAQGIEATVKRWTDKLRALSEDKLESVLGIISNPRKASKASPDYENTKPQKHLDRGAVIVSPEEPQTNIRTISLVETIDAGIKEAAAQGGPIYSLMKKLEAEN
jgi:hypothetical protein